MMIENNHFSLESYLHLKIGHKFLHKFVKKKKIPSGLKFRVTSPYRTKT